MKETTKKTIIHIALFALAILAIVILALRANHLRDANRELRENQEALLETCQSYEYRDSLNGIEVGRLQLQIEDLEYSHQDITELCRDLKIKMKDVETAAKAASKTVVEVKVPVRDTIIEYRDKPIEAKAFTWSDNYVNIEGVMDKDSVACNVESYDTITQIVHRIPKCKLFGWGTKAIRQEIVSSNPHTKLVYAEYIEMKRK